MNLQHTHLFLIPFEKLRIQLKLLWYTTIAGILRPLIIQKYPDTNDR